MRVCRKCGIEKHESFFRSYIRKDGRGRYRRWSCRECDRALDKQSRRSRRGEPKDTRVYTEALLARVTELSRARHTRREIANIIGVSKNSLCQAIYRHNVLPRPVPEKRERCRSATDELLIRIWQYRQAGLSFTAIARRCGVKRGVISGLIFRNNIDRATSADQVIALSPSRFRRQKAEIEIVGE